MRHQDDFFTPDEVDRQIDQVSQGKAGDRADAEALAYLRNYYQTDSVQEQQALNRIWGRIAPALPAHQDAQARNIVQLDRSAPGSMTSREQPPRHPRRSSFMQRVGMLAAAVFLVALVSGLALVFNAAHHNSAGNGTATPTIRPTTQPTTAPTLSPSPSVTAATAPFQVTSVVMSVTPGSIAGMACGTNLTVTYTATFHVAPNSAGGVVRFTYSIDNGRGTTPAMVTLDPGQTTKTYTFTWSGALPADHSYPEPGGVQVSSPNALTSQPVGPTGMCTAAAFQVTSINMAVSPMSIAGLACGTFVTETYTATIYVATGSSGGTVLFTYTTTNGRGSSPITSLTFSPGQTTKSYSFTWSGALPADHTRPEPGGIEVTSPNFMNSTLLGPAGACS